MNKVYTRINWENYPSEKTAVNESNLNKMDSALNEIDTRVVEHETTKANVASLNELINYWHIDETTGVITIHKVSGEQIIFDLNIEKVPVGFSMTDDGILIMTTDDGTEFTANIGSMIPVITFNDSEQIAVAVSGEGVNKSYTFTIKTGSISEDKLQPNFLADCRLYAGNAEESANKAEEYAEKAQELVDEAEASFTELSYADYQAGNYDATKSYAIPDYPYINDSQKWKFVGSATGQNAISLPENFNELYVIMEMNSVYFYFYVINEVLSGDSIMFREGYYYSDDYNASVSLYISNKTVKIQKAAQNKATDYTSTSSIKVWRR